MKTQQATRLYNKAEAIVKEKYPLYTINPIERARKIDEELTEIHGEDMADEILELVFENEIR